MVTKDTTASNEYVTIYEASYSSNNKIGDAIRETSTTGSSSTGWNSDNSTYGTSTVPGFLRGGAYNYSTGAGIFAFTRTAGTVNDQYGFRVCLAF